MTTTRARISLRTGAPADARRLYALSAFTHAPGYFMAMGCSIVPHLWVSEKVYTDCVKCQQFRTCGQYAMVLPLETLHDAQDRDEHLLMARHA